MEFSLRKWRLSDAKELAAALNNRHILNNQRSCHILNVRNERLMKNTVRDVVI